MQAPNKLFLEFKDDSKFHVIDSDNNTIGAAYEIPEAIQEARKTSKAPIDIEDSHAGFERLCVAEKPNNAIADTEVFIAALAEIGGMKVTKLFDDNIHFIGYTMEPLEEDDFMKAEEAADKAEEQLLRSFDCYFEEEA